MIYLWLKWFHFIALGSMLGWMLIFPIMLYWHNKKGEERVLGQLERMLLRSVGYGVVFMVVASGVALAMENVSIMRSDWFYLKLFALALLFVQFFHYRGVVIQDRIEQLGYGTNYFLKHLFITLVLVGFILFLSLFKPL